MSLRKVLINEIELKGYLTLEKLHSIALVCGYKVSNAERRLRELTVDNKVIPVRNGKGHITGYKTTENAEMGRISLSDELSAIMAEKRRLEYNPKKELF